jgi:hypothetical protein
MGSAPVPGSISSKGKDPSDEPVGRALSPVLHALQWRVRALCPRMWTCHVAKFREWCLSAPSSPTQPGFSAVVVNQGWTAPPEHTGPTYPCCPGAVQPARPLVTHGDARGRPRGGARHTSPSSLSLVGPPKDRSPEDKNPLDRRASADYVCYEYPCLMGHAGAPSTLKASCKATCRGSPQAHRAGACPLARGPRAPRWPISPGCRMGTSTMAAWT